MTPERFSQLAQDAAKAAKDTSLPREECHKIMNPKEIRELPATDQSRFLDMMLSFIRELSKGE